MTATAKKNLPATKTAIATLSQTEYTEIRQAYYQACDGVGTLVRELDNVASRDPRLAELHTLFAKMDALLTDSALGAVL
jgi:hypothetical protein